MTINSPYSFIKLRISTTSLLSKTGFNSEVSRGVPCPSPSLFFGGTGIFRPSPPIMILRFMSVSLFSRNLRFRRCKVLKRRNPKSVKGLSSVMLDQNLRNNSGVLSDTSLKGDGDDDDDDGDSNGGCNKPWPVFFIFTGKSRWDITCRCGGCC